MGPHPAQVLHPIDFIGKVSVSAGVPAIVDREQGPQRVGLSQRLAHVDLEAASLVVDIRNDRVDDIGLPVSIVPAVVQGLVYGLIRLDSSSTELNAGITASMRRPEIQSGALR